jgi:hypothetical protein
MNYQPYTYLWWLIATFAVVGLADAFLPSGGSYYGALTFPAWAASAILLFNWCKAHVQTLGIKEPTGSAALCGFFAPIGVPLYFFRAFGFKRGLRGTLKAFGVYVLLSTAYVGTNALGKYVVRNTSLNQPDLWHVSATSQVGSALGARPTHEM